jgi:NhaP-type Na+/H+ or K+/H+ antiporter
MPAMALSLALVVLLSLTLDYALRRLRIPGLVGMLALGVLFGPHALNLLSPSLIAISSDLRRIALVVILLRAGLLVSRESLRQLGWRVALLSTVPSLAEGIAVALVAPAWLGLSRFSAVLLGAVLAAVSPAVVVPTMIEFQNRGRGVRQGIPTLLLAAGPLDNVIVIVVFGALIRLAQGTSPNLLLGLGSIPLAIVTGAVAGVLLGWALYRAFARFDPRATKRVLVVLSLGILLVALESQRTIVVAFSGLVAVMAMGFTLLERSQEFAAEVAAKLGKVWILAEILLFVLVGAQVDVNMALDVGLAGLGVVATGLLARSLATWLALCRSSLTWRERLFCVAAYTPKATVQAAIGATPAALGLPGGDAILAVAVVAVIVTAPLGAIAMRQLGLRWLPCDDPPAVIGPNPPPGRPGPRTS